MSRHPHSDHRTINDAFAARGIALTRQRLAIWEYFSGAEHAATIGEVADVLKPEGIGQATVYRTVALLMELGLLVRVQDRSGEICYTATRIGHNHPLICTTCRKVVDFSGEGDLTYLEKQLERDTGFVIYGHHLEVYGECPACRERAAARGVSDGAKREKEETQG